VEPENPLTGALTLFDARNGKEFLEEFRMESDRAAAILAGAYLDQSLLQILRRSVVPKLGLEDKLLGTDKPLGTFSARINVCAAFGLIGEEEFRDLHWVRRIRNAFAHGQHGLTFDSPELAKFAGQSAILRRFSRPLQETTRSQLNTVTAVLMLLLSDREAQATPVQLAQHQWSVTASPPSKD